MSEPALKVEQLTKRYGSLIVTDDVSFDVVAGELHGLIGPNGAGKTTLINQISGFTAPDTGKIYLKGEDVTTAAPYDRARHGLARSFQVTSVFPNFTVLENVALAVQARSGSSFRFTGRASQEQTLNKAAAAALEKTGIAHRAGAPAMHLSYGERRALELAIALAAEPEVLLLDEPLAGLGRAESMAQVELIGRLKGTLAIILVEHDMAAVFTLADRVSVLINGRVAASGAPDRVRANPEVISAYLGP